MSELNWDQKVWKVIDSYFKSTDNYLTKNQIDSYNTFLEKNIPKTIKQFNPINIQFGSNIEIDKLGDDELDKYLVLYSLLTTGNPTEKRIRLQEEYDKDIEKFRHEINIYVGATPVWNSDKSQITDIVDDLKGIYIGKPIIQEMIRDGEAKKIVKKSLYPNEARLKNLTYKAEIKVDLLVEKIINKYKDVYNYSNIKSALSTEEKEFEKSISEDLSNIRDNKIKRQRLIKYFQKQNRVISLYSKVTLGNIPIMLQSRACSLNKLHNVALTKVGECKHDQGGYFIIDGKEKVIVAQERDINNKVYANFKKDQEYKVIANIRSAAENKFIPARITKVCILKEKLNQNTGNTIVDNTIRVKIPLIEKEIPLFILFRALGFYSDREIVDIICNESSGNSSNFSKYYHKMLEMIEPSINESSYIINNQKDALDFLIPLISKNFMKDAPKTYNMKHKCLMEILKNHFLPHCGQGLLEKGYFLAFMVQKALHVLLKIEPETDRDNYMYKRIDISGYLLSQIFRDLYFRVKNKLLEVVRVGYSKKFGSISIDHIPDEDFYKLIDNNKYNNSLLPNQIIDKSIINEGMMYAFKNCWGLKDAPCKAGVVQDITRISYIGFISHLRRINTPLSKSAKVRAPHSLHGSSWGIMCPSETPDGGNIGIRKNLAITALITPGTSSFLLDRLVYTLGVKDIKTKTNNNLKNLPNTRVFLNERILGYIETPLHFYTVMKLLKRNGYINIYISISWDKQNNIISISTDSGRGIRPVFIVEKNNIIRLTQAIINELEKNMNVSSGPASKEGEVGGIKQKNINWKNLLVGLNKTIIHADTDDRCYVTDELLEMGTEDAGSASKVDKITGLIQYLRDESGIIEYIDTNESNTALIALNPSDLSSKINRYDYCEISPTLILSILACQIPGLSMNQAPRNQFSTSQGKQTLGLYASNYRNRMDVKGQILHYPQKPLIKSKFSKYLFTDELPHGMNAIVAIGCFSGYNQEDSIILNKDAIHRGLFKSSKFRTYSQRETIDNGKLVDKICNPTYFEGVRNMHAGDYSKLGDNGIIRMEENLKVNENDIIVGKCLISNEKDSEGKPILYDSSDYVRRGEDGYVDRVFMNEGNDGQKYCKIRIRKDKLPELGDKFASRHGQKGTIGMVLPQKDLPRTKEGIVPDIIVNTHAFPSRMTIAQFFELLLGKVCVINGCESELAPFTHMIDSMDGSDNIIDNVRNMLKDLNYEQNANEVMYSGITGEMLKVNFFIGPTFYQRLTHQVSDKQQSRAKGSKTALARQPVSGRAAGGGGRIGEMERDAILSHGAAAFLKESFMERSDKYQFWISCKTGLISAVNPEKNIYKDLAADSSKQSISLLARLQDSKDIIVKGSTETSRSEFICVQAPYAFKLLIQEIEASGIAPRLVSDRVLKKWRSLAVRNNGIVILNEEDEELLKDSYGKQVIINPMYKFHNDIKRSLLLYISSKSKMQYNEFRDLDRASDTIKDYVKKELKSRAGTLIDFSVGVGGDLHKWYSADFNIILGIDISEENIERDASDETEGSYYSDKEGALKRLSNLKRGIKTHSRQKEWAKKSKIDFIVGDSSKLLNLDQVPISPFVSSEEIEQNMRIYDIASSKYKSKLIKFLTDNVNTVHANIPHSFTMRTLKFGSSVMFFSLHYLFDRVERLRNFFINCSKTLALGGYLVVTTFDGCRVLDKLLENKGTYSYEGQWSITLESDIKVLSSSIENGFGKKINVFVDSIGTQNIEYLVNPTLLITFAKMMGFSLEETDSGSRLEHPTNTFDNILYQSKYKEDLNKNIPLKNFSDLNRYFIFKKTAELESLYTPVSADDINKIEEYPIINVQSDFMNIVPSTDTKFKKKIYDKTLRITMNTEILGTNYNIGVTNIDNRDIRAPFKICANIKQINNYIDLPRAYVGNPCWLNLVGPLNNVSEIYEYNNCEGVLDIFKNIIDRQSKLSIYQDINDKSLENTLEYIYSNVKIGIYVKIVNEVLYNFIPIMNFNEDKFTNEFLTKIISEDGEERTENIFINIENYHSLLYKHRAEFDNLSNAVFVKTLHKKYLNLLVGSDALEHIIPQYFVYKDFIQNLLISSRSGNGIKINDNEFIINVLNMPIVKLAADESDQILNPFFEKYSIAGSGLSSNNKLVPILSSYMGTPNENIKYGDLLIPDIHSYVIANNIQNTNVSFIETYNMTSECDTILFNNNDGYGQDNIRKMINENKDFFKSLFIESGRELLEIMNVSTEFNKHSAFIEDTTSPGESEQDKNYKVSSVPSLNAKGFPIFSSATCKSVLFIEGFSSDHILTYSLAYRKPLIIIKNQASEFHLWYESMFVSYNFTEGHDNSKANIFILEMTDILETYNKSIKTELDKQEREIKLLEIIRDEINKCNRIISDELSRHKSEEDGTSISNKELQANKSKYSLLGGILDNAIILSNNIFGNVIHANSKEDEDVNCNKMYQLLGASINSISFNFINEPKVVKLRENMGDIISCRIPIKEMYLEKIKTTILNNDLMTYYIGEPFMMSGIKYLYLKLSIENTLFTSITNKIKEMDPDESGEDSPVFMMTPEPLEGKYEYTQDYGPDTVKPDGALITPPGESPPPYTPLTPTP
uniref:DNA-directed RNA polymerase n=1 Tax=viral metagenome TaxID=1070528 RepID=A0A6C0B3T1_9ZZZZ